VADSDPKTFFRPNYVPEVWHRRRLFQSNGVAANVYYPFKRRYTLFRNPEFIHRERRLSTILQEFFWGHITLLWGPN
jgi:hypothetical protein